MPVLTSPYSMVSGNIDQNKIPPAPEPAPLPSPPQVSEPPKPASPKPKPAQTPHRVHKNKVQEENEEIEHHSHLE